MSKKQYNLLSKTVEIKGKGLLSKDSVSVLVNRGQDEKGIIFVVNETEIPAKLENVSNAIRNTVLSNKGETICLVEHFLAACSLLGVNNIRVKTNKNELVFEDGSALHFKEPLESLGFSTPVFQKFDLKEVIFIKSEDKEILAIPHDGFKVSYLIDYPYDAIGRNWASWEIKDGIHKLLRARTFGLLEENSFFGVENSLLTLTKKGFNKKLHEPFEPLYHKILDIIGDLTLTGFNPLEINMHVIGIKSGHTLNIELAKKLHFCSL